MKPPSESGRVQSWSVEQHIIQQKWLDEIMVRTGIVVGATYGHDGSETYFTLSWDELRALTEPLIAPAPPREYPMPDTPASELDAVCAVTPGGMRHKADRDAGRGCLCHGLAFCEKHHPDCEWWPDMGENPRDCTCAGGASS